MRYADIVLPLAQPLYTFAVAEGVTLCEGMAVVVPFGRSKIYTGIVWRLHDRRPDFKTVKTVSRVLYGTPLLDERQRRFWEWVADYYMCTLGEVMRVALPSLMKPSGHGEEEFAAYLQKYRLEDVVVAHGAKYGNDKEMYWMQADLFILPTYNECFPLVLLEAMQHGVACIASHEGGIVDIIDEGETGYIVPMKDALALAEKVAYCMEHRDLCREMGRKGRMKFECEFTLQRFEERMCDILKKLV